MTSDDAVIGYGADIGDDAVIGDGVIIGEHVKIGDHVLIGEDARIEYVVEIHENVVIGEDARIGYLAGIHENVVIGERAMIDDYSIIQSEVKGKVIRSKHIKGKYKYDQDIIWTEDKIYIRMGSITKTVKEWKDDFWNNDIEFPEGSEEGTERLSAFNYCMNWLGLEELVA